MTEINVVTFLALCSFALIPIVWLGLIFYVVISSLTKAHEEVTSWIKNEKRK